MFLIARYREEMLGGMEQSTALQHALARVGGSISAAATVICGIGVLAFMQFGKVREAGLVIPFTLFIVLAGTLTFTAALLRLTGRWAFWPHRESTRSQAKTLVPTLWQRFVGWDIWNKIGPVLSRWPGLIGAATLAVMAPFAVVAVIHYQDENYNPIADLPASVPSVAGTQALQKHFPLGLQGILTVFVHNEQVDFRPAREMS